MNVSLKNNDAVSAILKIEVEKNDYVEQWNKSLRKLRQKANLPGFRQGMVPLELIKKMYGRQTLAEEINKLVSERLYSYLKENRIMILGDPLPNETEQKTIDFETDETFEFCFDLALSPKVDIQLTKEDQLTYYKVLIDDEMVDKQVDSYRKSYGSYEKADEADENETYKEAELNQDFFDRIFGADIVKSEAEFRDKIKESILNQYVPETDFRFRKDVRDLLIRKTDALAFADDILKRWLLMSNEKITKESIDDDFPKVKNDLKYHLAKEKIVADFEIKVEKGEIESMAKGLARFQFAQYGAYSGLDDMIDNYVKDMMKKQDTVNNLADRVIEIKVIDCVKETITVNEQEVTREEFEKLMKEQE